MEEETNPQPLDETPTEAAMSEPEAIQIGHLRLASRCFDVKQLASLALGLLSQKDVKDTLLVSQRSGGTSYAG